MQSAMNAYTEAIIKAIEAKFSDIMAQVAQQLTVGIEDAMNDMMKKVGTNMQKTLQQVMTQITSSMDDCDDAGDESAWKRNGACAYD